LPLLEDPFNFIPIYAKIFQMFPFLHVAKPNPVHISLTSLARFMSSPSHPPPIDTDTNIKYVQYNRKHNQTLKIGYVQASK
jgi:hypothetical protein